MPRIKVVTLALVAVLLASLLAALFLAPRPGNNTWLMFNPYLALALGTAVLFVSSAILFIMGLGSFKDKLKRTFTLVCVSLALLAVAFVQLPLFLYLMDISEFWKDSSVTAIPFALSIIMVYVGARSLARLFGIRNFTTNVWFEIAGITAAVLVVVLTPHVPTTTPEIKLNSTLGATATSTFNMFLAAILVYQAKRAAGVMYTNSLAWMSVSFATQGLGGFAHILAAKSLGDQQWYLIGSVPMIPLFIGGLFMLRAAYSFNTITATGADTQGWVARNFFGKPLSPQKSTQRSSVDIVVYAANLASSPTEINDAREKLRQVTAHLANSPSISAEDEQTLMNIYLQIEQYLVEKEPIRKFTKESLRQGIAQKLGLTGTTSTSTFWQKLA